MLNLLLLTIACFACGFYLGKKRKEKSYERSLKQINSNLEQKIINIEKLRSQNNSFRKHNVN